jgi:hypothetical protein
MSNVVALAGRRRPSAMPTIAKIVDGKRIELVSVDELSKIDRDRYFSRNLKQRAVRSSAARRASALGGFGRDVVAACRLRRHGSGAEQRVAVCNHRFNKPAVIDGVHLPSGHFGRAP